MAAVCGRGFWASGRRVERQFDRGMRSWMMAMVMSRRHYSASSLIEGPEAVNWYPGHMASATRNIRGQIKSVDFILEIRDARIPLSSANQELQEVLNMKKRLIVLNKMDLANPNMMLDVPCLVQEQPKRAKVGPLPGVTRHVAGFKIGERPSTYVLDTPGVLVPNIENIETGMKLALTGAVKDTVIGEERLARYLLSVLNARSAHLHWKSGFAKSNATTIDTLSGVRDLLASACLKFDGSLENKQDMESLVDVQMNLLRRFFHVPVELGEAGLERVSQHLLEFYRKGRLGQFTLDIVPGKATNILNVKL
ncbi:hypothetical protein AXG93_312s1100 [Marchantia polymorpha subsp. ruderalis]|uniref:Mitochondrial GTPase 1 n=1 Tax=Marchantia polymorpha subsp. ruderalis TaxID=1480154 RepID=A0A176W7T2_MARPO|nr:hypothetical protein AXG93_312s1100 [Marchantia polymorpha subsp. ruderalis]